MRKQRLAFFAFWGAFAGCWLAFSETRLPASQDRTPEAVAAPRETPSLTPSARRYSSVDHQMLGLERHARVDMILYQGRFGEPALADASRALPAVALSLNAGSE